jgi:hypothetical protein
MIDRTESNPLASRLKERLLEPGGLMCVAPVIAALDDRRCGGDGAAVVLCRLLVAAAAFDALADTDPATGDAERCLRRYAARETRRQLRLAATKARRAPLSYGAGLVQDVAAAAGKLVLGVLEGAY